nr:MAG TPA: hypothetical protein [Caudoviricetes sp.]
MRAGHHDSPLFYYSLFLFDMKSIFLGIYVLSTKTFQFVI